MSEPKIDFAIITALKDERDAVLNAFRLTTKHRIRKENKRTYWCGRLKLKDGEFYQILVAQSFDQANVAAALLTNDTIHEWNPGAMLLVGIAGAASEEQKPGDLVIGEHSYYYERGKITPLGTKPEPYTIPANFILSDRIKSLPKWKTRRRRPDGTTVSPNIHSGVIAVGEKVIADAAIRNNLASQHRQIKAVEMESYGFSLAAWQSFSQVPHLVIKAIQDSADASKNDSWRQYAVEVAAAYAKHFLRDRPLKPRNPPVREPLSGDKRYQLIFDNFAYGYVIPFLGTGITPSIYINLASQLTEEVGKELLEEEWDSSDRDNMRRMLIENLIGLPSSGCHYLTQDDSTLSPIIEEPNDPLEIEQALILAKMDLRFLSQYFHLGKNTPVFYKRLRKLTNTMVIPLDGETKKLYEFFTELPQRARPKLIVTTTYDNYLEQAFSLSGQPFDVVFYKVDAIESEDGRKEGMFMHQSYDLDKESLKKSLPIKDRDYKLPVGDHPIILQLYGRWDDNFVITQDHFNDLLQDLQKLPTDLRKILAENSSILFLGYSSNDYELQLLVDRLLKEKILTKSDVSRSGFTSWLLHQCQPGDIKTAIWEKRQTIKLIEIQSTWIDFVSNLKTAIDQKIETRKRKAG